MHRQEVYLKSLTKSEGFDPFVPGGLFLEDTIPTSFFLTVPKESNKVFASLVLTCQKSVNFGVLRARKGWEDVGFLSVSLSSIKDSNGSSEGVDGGYFGESNKGLRLDGENSKVSVEVEVEEEKVKVKGSGALNTTKHLWAGAVAAMVSRYNVLSDSYHCVVLPFLNIFRVVVCITML